MAVVLPMAVVCGAALADSGQPHPNIILLLADDLGFSSIETYGGDVATPNLSDLAADGAQFNNFYVQPRCSPTRAALMTGHQNHKVGFPVLIGDGADLAKNHVFLPELLRDNGYSTYLSGKWHLGSTDNFGTFGPIPGNDSTDPRVRGFDHAFTFGNSSHSEDNWNISDYRLLTDGRGAASAFVAPASRYATEMDGDSNRYDASGVFVDSGGATPEFYQTDAIVDYSLDFLAHHRAQNTANGTNNPFFQYVAFGAPHFPIQAPQEVVDKYASVHPDGSVTGRYAEGWDAVRSDRRQQMIDKGIIPSDLIQSPRGDAYQSPGNDGGKVQLIPWADVPENRKPTLIRAMATYAAMVDVVDQQIGRIVDDLKTNGEFDNTLIMFMTDNGANAEGDVYGLGGNPQQNDNPVPGPLTETELKLMGTNIDPIPSDQRTGTGWANVEASPFRNYKHFEHEGGIKSPLIVSWPDGLHPSLTADSTATPIYETGNNDVMHVTDVMPTLLDLLDIELPDEYTSVDGETYDVVDFNPTTENWVELLTNGTALGEREFGSMHEGNRMYRKGDWKLVSSNFAGNDGEDSTPNNTIAGGENPTLIGANEWELYNLAHDHNELNNLAGDPAYANIFNELISKYALWAFQTNVNSSLPDATSDFNFDGQQDELDLDIFIDNWLAQHSTIGIESFQLGDRNFDGVNDLADWVLIRRDFMAAGAGALLENVSFGGAAVPEPATLRIIVAFGIALLWSLRARKRRAFGAELASPANSLLTLSDTKE